ncbi:hypothetical protein ACVWYH_008988 [Bradyrhizobium sp. GM24.11]
MDAVEAERRLEFVAVDHPRAVGHDAAVIGDGTGDGEDGPERLLAVGPPQHVGDGFADRRMVGDLHIVDWADLLAIAQREARIGAADIGEKNVSCLADTHDHLAAIALQALGTLFLHSLAIRMPRISEIPPSGTASQHGQGQSVAFRRGSAGRSRDIVAGCRRLRSSAGRSTLARMAGANCAGQTE